MMARHKASVRKKSPQQQTQMLKSRIEASETRALSETARVYCAGHRSESNKAAKQHQRDIKAFVSAHIESDTTQRAKEARRTERSLIQAKKDRRDFRTVGLPPHKMSYRIFKLRFPASSYQRACDPHHVDNTPLLRANTPLDEAAGVRDSCAVWTYSSVLMRWYQRLVVHKHHGETSEGLLLRYERLGGAGSPTR